MVCACKQICLVLCKQSLTLRHLCPENSCMTWLSLSTHYFLAGRRGRNPTVRRGFVTEPRLFPFRSCIPFGGQADSFACPCQLVLPMASPLPWATPDKASPPKKGINNYLFILVPFVVPPPRLFVPFAPSPTPMSPLLIVMTVNHITYIPMIQDEK